MFQLICWYVLFTLFPSQRRLRQMFCIESGRELLCIILGSQLYVHPSSIRCFVPGFPIILWWNWHFRVSHQTLLELALHEALKDNGGCLFRVNTTRIWEWMKNSSRYKLLNGRRLPLRRPHSKQDRKELVRRPFPVQGVSRHMVTSRTSGERAAASEDTALMYYAVLRFAVAGAFVSSSAIMSFVLTWLLASTRIVLP